ncbi:MAG TPA: GNAT family N-acetyltransferase [Terriglobales bacterium]|nr:GNAT family N-acetyltransferase [Terriglobales bacterium]
MNKGNSELPPGYSPVPRGCIATVVTSLEMNARPQTTSAWKFPAEYELAELDGTDLSAYRGLFRKVGQDWLWHSRLTMSDEELRRILSDPLDAIFVLRHRNEDVGLLELDFRQRGECELAFFGLVAGEIGKGLGRALMKDAIERAWARPIRRFWVHTCTLDHPGALGFYVKSGFRPYAFQVEVQPDPRLTGHLPRKAAPQVPLIE